MLSFGSAILLAGPGHLPWSWEREALGCLSFWVLCGRGQQLGPTLLGMGCDLCPGEAGFCVSQAGKCLPVWLVPCANSYFLLCFHHASKQQLLHSPLDKYAGHEVTCAFCCFRALVSLGGGWGSSYQSYLVLPISPKSRIPLSVKG